MLTENDRVRLEHILDAMDKIGDVLAGCTQTEFIQDWKKQLMVERFWRSLAKLPPI